MEDLETIVQQKLDADSDFTASIASLSEEEKTKAIEKKKSEIAKAEFASMAEKAKESDKKFLDQQARAKKAEEDAKKAKPVTDDLSQDDILVLARAGIHDDDIDEVKDFAKFKKISVKEALKNESLKAVLAHNAEVRKSAEVANAKPARAGAQEVGGEAILADAMNNDKIPSKGSTEAEKLFWARRGGKR